MLISPHADSESNGFRRQ